MASLLRTARCVRPALAAQPGSRLAPIALRRRYASASAEPLFPDEPREPIIQTSIPGPESKKAIERLSKVFDTRSLNMMADYQRSYGN